MKKKMATQKICLRRDRKNSCASSAWVIGLQRTMTNGLPGKPSHFTDTAKLFFPFYITFATQPLSLGDDDTQAGF
jgi:hypothetical protein